VPETGSGGGTGDRDRFGRRICSSPYYGNAARNQLKAILRGFTDYFRFFPDYFPLLQTAENRGKAMFHAETGPRHQLSSVENRSLSPVPPCGKPVSGTRSNCSKKAAEALDPELRPLFLKNTIQKLAPGTN